MSCETAVLRATVISRIVLGICIALSLNIVAASACIENGTPLPRFYEKVLRHCETLYRRKLPLDKITGEIVSPVERVAHYRKYKELYKQYDRDCFFKWDNLRCYTASFLKENVGAIFEVGNPRPFCTAFRLTTDIIMTAGHCADGISSGAVLRLYGHPLVEIKIGAGIVVPQDLSSLSDLHDFALYRLVNPSTASAWNFQTFSRDVTSRQAIFIVAPSLISDEAFDSNALIDNWLKQVRFSRAPSNQIWLPSEMHDHPVEAGPAREECLFHQNSTFTGMSGAPIIASTRPSVLGGVPTFHVIGIHLRNGFGRTSDCGQHYPYNVGIKIPASVLDAIFPVQANGQR
ncbi:MAG: trypsin-like serine protease [Mesorhizobium sp.]|nr:MAG: trypsin-like serine protease [Mesorhizobium sp.]